MGLDMGESKHCPCFTKNQCWKQVRPREVLDEVVLGVKREETLELTILIL